MQSVTGSVAAGLTFPVEVLMKSAPAAIAMQRRAADVVVRAELARLEDHLEVRVAARLLHADDLVEDLRVAAREERAAVDDHVDLVGAELDDGPRLGDLDLRRRLPGGERRRDGCDLHAAAREALLRDADEARVDADRRDRRHGAVDGIRPHRLRAERSDLARACPDPRASSGPSSAPRARAPAPSTRA